MIFDKENVAQVAGYFLWKQGGTLPYIKLLKLVYLADREALLSLGDTLTGDTYAAMKLGPVPYQTYNSLKHNELPTGWVVTDGYVTRLKKQVNEVEPLETFDLITPAMQEVMDSVLQKYGKYEKYTLSELTHDICPEWEKCKNVSIELSDILEAAGKSTKEINDTLAAIAENDELLKFSASLS